MRPPGPLKKAGAASRGPLLRLFSGWIRVVPKISFREIFKRFTRGSQESLERFGRFSARASGAFPRTLGEPFLERFARSPCGLGFSLCLFRRLAVSSGAFGKAFGALRAFFAFPPGPKGAEGLFRAPACFPAPARLQVTSCSCWRPPLPGAWAWPALPPTSWLSPRGRP